MPRCAVCGQDNPGGFRFCGACGASLTAPPRAPAEERRLVTVLFCDLVGFTARSDQADPEDVGALLRPYHARLRAEVHRFGGTLDKFIGDPGGLDDLREALRVALDAGLTYQAGLWYANLADKLGEFDPAAGLATFRDGIGFARRRGLTELAMWMGGGALDRRFE